MLKNTKGRLFEVMSRLDKTFKPKLNEGDASNKIYGEDFNKWRNELIKIIMAGDQGLTANEIALNDEEIFDYFKQGKTPEEVLNNIWMNDAGNFYNVSWF